jgi:uncharacterized protein (TIGR02246 family)
MTAVTSDRLVVQECSAPGAREPNRTLWMSRTAGLGHVARSRTTLILVTGLLACGVVHAQESDVAAIRALQDAQADAWNRHDAAAYARLFVADGDVVNVLGWWWRGREEIERKLSEAFAVVFAESELRIVEVHTRLLAPAYAIAHVRWTMDGAKAPPGAPAPPREGVQLQVLRKGDDGWRIVSFQNTNSVPETPFPIAPPAPVPP